MATIVQKILGFLIHFGPLKGNKTVLGAVLNLVSVLVPPQYQAIVEMISQVLLAQGLVSKAVDVTGVLPARKRVAFPVD